MVLQVGQGKGDQTFGHYVGSFRLAGYCVTFDVGDPVPAYLTKSVEVVSFDHQPIKTKEEYVSITAINKTD
jgi:hypothetical protein